MSNLLDKIEKDILNRFLCDRDPYMPKAIIGVTVGTATFFKTVINPFLPGSPYLLELVRYIHRTPLREGLVTDLGYLDKYSFSIFK